MAGSQTVRDLQAYIYKRPRDASAEEVFERIEAVDAKDKLTAANRDALIIPACSHPDVDVIQWLIEYGARPQSNSRSC